MTMKHSVDEPGKNQKGDETYGYGPKQEFDFRRMEGYRGLFFVYGCLQCFCHGFFSFVSVGLFL
jgi:hypothetical protein